eukprot:SAG31_NODE_1126_length_9767_cov_5.580058_6_plen_207_part_00
MNNIDSRISDADHRLVDDVCSFSGTIHSMMYSGGFLNPLVTLAWFTVRLGLFVGPRIPAALVLYNLVSFFILKTLMPDYKKIVANEQEAEGKFKFVHSRVKQHAESIAFFGGDAREKRLCQGRFVKVMELDWQRQVNLVISAVPTKFSRSPTKFKSYDSGWTSGSSGYRECSRVIFRGCCPGLFSFISANSSAELTKTWLQIRAQR